MNFAPNFRRQTSESALPVYGQNHARKRARPCKSCMACWDAARFDRFCRALYPAAPHLNVAADTGVPAATVRKHMSGETTPTAARILAYVAAYGPAFLAAMLPASDWIARAADDEARREMRRTLERAGSRYG